MTQAPDGVRAAPGEPGPVRRLGAGRHEGADHGGHGHGERHGRRLHSRETGETADLLRASGASTQKARMRISGVETADTEYMPL